MSLKLFNEEYGVTSDYQLQELAYKAKIPLVEINFAEDIKIDRNGAYIINLGDRQISGTHWTGLWIEGNSAFYFDSFAGPPEDILIKKIKDYGIKFLIFNSEYEFQRIEENLCGVWVLMFLYFMNLRKGSIEDRFKKMYDRYEDTIPLSKTKKYKVSVLSL